MCIVRERPIGPLGLLPQLDGHVLVEAAGGIGRQQPQTRPTLDIADPMHHGRRRQLQATPRDLHVRHVVTGFGRASCREQQRGQLQHIDIEAKALVKDEYVYPDVQPRGDLNYRGIPRHIVEPRRGFDRCRCPWVIRRLVALPGLTPEVAEPVAKTGCHEPSIA